MVSKRLWCSVVGFSFLKGNCLHFACKRCANGKLWFESVKKGVSLHNVIP